MASAEERVFWGLFEAAWSVQAQQIEWLIEAGDKEWTRWLDQQERTVSAFNEIAFFIDTEAHPEFKGDIDVMKQCGMAYKHELQKLKFRRVAKNQYRDYLSTLTSLHNEMARHCRRLYVHFCPDGVPLFDIAFRGALNGG